MNFFFEKQQIKFCTNPELWGCVIFRSKIAHLSWTFFFGTNHYYYFHLPIGPFRCAKFFEKSYRGSRVMRMHHFWTQNGPFAPEKFFWKIIKITLIYLLASFIVQNFLKILLVDPELWGCAIFGPKMRIFFRKPFNEPCFFHSCLSIYQKSNWNLIGQEPFLAITWELDFSQACSFCRMLMNHKELSLYTNSRQN